MRKDWEYKKLGEVCDILDSQRKPVTKKDRKKGIYPYYGATGIQDFVDNYIFDGRYVLVGEDGAKWSANEKCAYIIEGKTWINNHAHVLSTKNMVIDSFLTYYLNFSDLDSYISGAIIRKLTQSSLKSIPIPLPPKPTQLAIVAELDKINELIQLKKQQLKDYDQLAQSIFYEMFGDPVENEKGWEVKKISEVSIYYNGKAHENDIDESGKYILINSKFISSEGSVLKRTATQHFPLYKNDVVMVLSDLPNGKALGKCCLITKDDIYSLNQRICCFRGFKGDSHFFKYMINRHPYFLSFDDGKGQTNLRKKDVENCPIPLPPLPLQQQFAARIEAIERQKQQVSETIKDLETLLASRMQYWFD